MRKDILREIKYVRHVSSRVISLLARIPSPCALKVNFQIFGRGMRSGFDELALIERRLKRLCINMIHAVASYLCRDIEVVITGLTRNQFVSNHTRVRIPLSAPLSTRYGALFVCQNPHKKTLFSCKQFGVSLMRQPLIISLFKVAKIILFNSLII